MDPARSVLWSIGAYLAAEPRSMPSPTSRRKKSPASGGSYGASSALRAGGNKLLAA
jgi:hypothetical protein